MRTAAFHTLGCKVNAYETEAMEQILIENGYKIVPFEEQADVYIINTCSVTNIADRKSRQMIHRARKTNPHAVVAAAGCYVQAVSEEGLGETGVDVIIGNNHKKEIAELLEAYFTGREQSAVSDMTHMHEYETLAVSQTGEHTRAYLKVQDGCNQFCSYCIIPYVRGRIRSRSLEDVVEECKRLGQAGIREVVLTGIHLSSYGKDWTEADSQSGSPNGELVTLLTLIRAIHQVETIERIRIGSLEPRIVTEEFAGALAQLPKVCPHFHLSLQSGCDSVLKRMNRHYTTQDYRQGCAILRKYFHNPVITTDVIVGFPGETEEEFQASLAFAEEIHFYEMHVFKYSRRRGTVADRMEQQISEAVKGVRSHQMMALAARMSQEYRQSLIGSSQTVLLEEEISLNGITYMTGYTKEYVRVAVQTEAASNTMVSGRAAGMLTKEILLLIEDRIDRNNGTRVKMKEK